MKLPIGFHSSETDIEIPVETSTQIMEIPTESVALVRFPNCNMPLSYYNDRFSLKVGDTVFVEGKYEGVAGVVEKISTNFRIKVEDYKKILGVADTKVEGQLKQLCGHFISFDREVLPYQKVLSWFKPVEDDTEGGYYISFDEPSFSLDEVGCWPFSQEVMQRGVDYFKDNKVLYLSLDGEKGQAIVEGSKPYEVAFAYRDGEISDLLCTCPCGFHCKHEAAVMIQLRETLAAIAHLYQEEYDKSNYFALVDQWTLLRFAIAKNSSAILDLH